MTFRPILLLASLAGAVALEGASIAGAGESTRPERAALASPEMSGAFFALSVRDLDEMAGWYETMLGMEVIVRAERPAPDGPVAVLRRGDLLIEMQMRSDADDPHTYTNGAKDAYKTHGVFKVGVFTSDIDAASAYLKAHGAVFNHDIVSTSEPLLLRTFAVHDPEGNTVQFFGE